MTKPINLQDVTKNGLLFQDHNPDARIMAYIPTPYPSNHAANLIELQNGDLLCTWFAGLEEGSQDIKIVFSRLPKGKMSWSAPKLLSSDYTRSEQNPSFFQEKNGRLWLLHTAQESRGLMTPEEWNQKLLRGEVTGHFSMQETAQIRRRMSSDNGYTWSDTESYFTKPGAFCRHPISVLSNGDWVFPIWYSLIQEDASKPQYGRDYSVVQISKDQGTTWDEYPVPSSERRVHMCILEPQPFKRPGHLLAFFRSRSADRIYRSFSQDYGRTWCVPTATCLANNNASIQAIRLQSGAIALVYNDCNGGDDPEAVLWPRSRVPVVVALTYDEGETFPDRRIVEFGDGFVGKKCEELNSQHHYPSIIQSRDGVIHLAYSFHGRICIKYQQISEDWIRGSK